MIFSCSDFVSVSSLKRNHKILMTIGCFVFIAHNSQSPWNVLLKILISDRNLLLVLIQPTVSGTWTHGWLRKSISRSTVGVWTNPVGVLSISKWFRKNYGYIEFVTTPGTFNLNFPKNHNCDDLGKAVIKISNFMCSDGPEWWEGEVRYLELDLKFSRSDFSSKTM